MWGAATIRSLSVLCFIGGAIVVRPASAEPVDDIANDAAQGLVLPFSATATRSIPVRLRPDSSSPEVGLLHEGATVSVSACAPDCAAPHAWALIGIDAAVDLEALARPRSTGATAPVAPAPETLWYGRVGKSGIKIFKEPRVDGPIVTRKRLSREMAFLPNLELRKGGWLERVEGGLSALAGCKFLRRASSRARPDHGCRWRSLFASYAGRGTTARVLCTATIESPSAISGPFASPPTADRSRGVPCESSYGTARHRRCRPAPSGSWSTFRSRR